MKNSRVLYIMAALFIACGWFSCTKDLVNEPQLAMTVKANIPLSDNAGDPLVYDSVQSLTFEFNAPVMAHTVPGNVKLFKVTAAGEQEEPAELVTNAQTPALVQVSKKDGTQFSEGDEYKIVINRNVKSTTGTSLENNFVGYFAVNYTFTLSSAGIAALDKQRSMIVCISDIHLGVSDVFTEFKTNRDALVLFLNQLRTAPNVSELVIAGDLIDEWFIPATEDALFGYATQRGFVQAIAANNKSVIDAFNNIIRDGKIKVTYVPGNHDLLITAEDIAGILPGINQARDAMLGLGAYSPDTPAGIVFEHGHRYNFFCAPDPISNQAIAPGSIMPPGYFFTRIAVQSVMEGYPQAGSVMPAVTANALGESQTLAFYYWSIWNHLMTEFPVSAGYDEKIIKANIDGFTGAYSINDLLPFQVTPGGFIDVNLYKGIQDSWDERQMLNNVTVKIPAGEAITRAAIAAETDDQAVAQYFTNATDKRLVVFGHTHEARIIPSVNNKGEKTIYANSGTWIDKNKLPTRTFVVITPQKSNDSAPAYVNLYQYSQNGDITKMDVQTLTGLNE